MKTKKLEGSKFMSNEERIAVLETTILSINATLLDIKQDIRSQADRTNNQIQEVKQDIRYLSDRMDTKFDRLESRLWHNFLWLMAMIFGLAGLVAHAYHWL